MTSDAWTVIGWAITAVDAVTLAVAVACIRRGRALEHAAQHPAAHPPAYDDEQPGTDTRLLHTCQAIEDAGTANRRNTPRGGRT